MTSDYFVLSALQLRVAAGSAAVPEAHAGAKQPSCPHDEATSEVSSGAEPSPCRSEGAPSKNPAPPRTPLRKPRRK